MSTSTSVSRIVDLCYLVAKEDVGTLGQPVSDLGIALRKHPVVTGEAEALVVLQEGNIGARARPFVLEDRFWL